MGIWGGVLTLVPILDIAYNWLQASEASLPEEFQYITVALGGVLSILGRLRAKEEIKGLF